MALRRSEQGVQPPPDSYEATYEAIVRRSRLRATKALAFADAGNIVGAEVRWRENRNMSASQSNPGGEPDNCGLGQALLWLANRKPIVPEVGFYATSKASTLPRK
jgi:hypothetical protein